MKPTPEAQEIRRKASRLRLARASKGALWRHLAHVGVLGWLFILPVLLGVFLGKLVAAHTGGQAPLLVGLFAGLVVGAYVTWRQVRRSISEDEEGGER
jgi:predicted F0F1-ATPase subunit